MGLQAADNHAGKQGKLTLRKAGRGQSKWAMQGQVGLYLLRDGYMCDGRVMDVLWMRLLCCGCVA
eukprot:3934510-Rhodomonas_salina.1